jgi:hypothetical protein
MAESALFQSYRATEKRKAEQALDEALGRAEESAPAGASQQGPSVAPDDTAPPKQEEGVLGSIKRGAKAVPERFMRGRDAVVGALSPVEQKGKGERALEGVLGVLDMVFPFAAFAGEVGGDLGEWVARGSGELTDEKLKAKLELAKKHAPGEAGGIEALLKIPYEQRVSRAREAASISSELTTGFIPGYTTAAKGLQLLTKAGKVGKGAGAVPGGGAIEPDLGDWRMPGSGGQEPPRSPQTVGPNRPSLTERIAERDLGRASETTARMNAEADARRPRTIDDVFTQMGRPNHRLTQTEIRDAHINLGAERQASGLPAAGPVVDELGEFKQMLSGGDYAILSAEKSHLLPEQNVARSKELSDELTRRGYGAIPASGSYGGAREGSFIVPKLPEDVAVELGKRFEQESVIGKRGLIYMDDLAANPTDLKNIDFSGAQEDYFSEVMIGGKPVKFTIPVDFDQRVAKEIAAPGDAAQIVQDGTGLAAVSGKTKLSFFQRGEDLHVVNLLAEKPSPRDLLRVVSALGEHAQKTGAKNVVAQVTNADLEAVLIKLGVDIPARGADDAFHEISFPVETLTRSRITEGGASSRGLSATGAEDRAAFEQVKRNDELLASREQQPFDPAAWAAERGVTFQGSVDHGPELGKMHEFREDRLTKGGNFSIRGELTRESAEGALGEHYKRWGVSPRGEVGDKIVGSADAARERLKESWKKFTDSLGDQNTLGIGIRGDVGAILNRQTFNDLVSVGSEILWTGARTFRRWAQEMVATFGEQIRPHLAALYPESQKKFADLADRLPDLPSVREALKLYKEGKFGEDWYEKIAEDLTRRFGKENGALYWKLVAATSPNTEVQANITLANRAFAMILSGERNADNLFRAGARAEGFDGFMKAHADNLNRVLHGLDVEGPKAGPFARAPYDPKAVVVDTWMFRAFGMTEMVKNSKGELVERVLDSEANFLFVQKAVTDIAQAMGVSPRQAQAAIWVAQKIRTEGADTLVKPFIEMMDLVAAKKAAEAAKQGRRTAQGSLAFHSHAVIARAILGAFVGSQVGDDPEQRAFNSLLAAGLFSVASRRIARDIVNRITDPEIRAVLKGEAGAIFPKRAPQQMPNTARMGTSREAKQVVRGINARLSEMGRLLRDKTLTHDETIANALRSKYRDVEELLKHTDGEGWTRPEDGVAARDARDLMLEDLLGQAARAKEAGDPALADQVWQQFLLASKVSEKVTNASTVVAQTQEAQKIVSRASRAKTVDYDRLAKEMAEFGRELEGAQVTRDNVVDALLELGDRAKAAKLAEDAKKAPSAFWKIYYGLNLLSSPLFHPKNLIGNSSAFTLSVAARGVGEVISYPFQLAGVRKIGSKPLIAPGETYDLLLGAVESIKDAWTAGKSTFHTGESIFTGPSKYADRLDLIQAQRAIQEPGGAMQVMIDAMARMAEKNLRFAGGTDEFYKVLSFAGEQRALSRRQAWSSGKRTWREAVEEQARLIRETPEDIVRGAESFAEYNTFTKAFDREPGALMSKLGAQRSIMAVLEDAASHPAARLTVAPFFRTPMRIAEFGTEYTPVLNLLAPKLWSDAMSGGANAQLAIAKIAMSAGMATVISSYAAAGFITGDWSRDPALRKRQQEAGFKPFSMYNPVTGHYWSYAGLGPLVAPLGAIATYTQMGPHLSDEGVLTHFMAIVLAGVKTNLAAPYFDALNDVVQIFESFDDDAMIGNGLKYVADRLRTFVPAAQLMRSVATTLDGEVKDLKEFGNQFDPAWRDVFNLFANTAANLPGLSRYVPAYRNIITGEPIPLEGGPFPGLISTKTDDPVQIEILELGGARLPRELPRYVGGDKAPAGTFRVYAPKPGTVAPLTHAQRTRLADLLTKDVKMDGLNLHQALHALIVGPGDDHDEYIEQSDGKHGGKALMIHNLWNAYLDEAEGRLIEEDKGLQEALRQAEIAKGRALTPPAQREEFEEMVR